MVWLCILLWLSGVTAFGQINLNGDYLVGSSASADFGSLTEVIDTLKTATFSGDVVFNLEAGVYHDILVLDTMANNSYSVTFAGIIKDSTVLEPIGNYNGAGIHLSNVNNMVFKDFIFEMDSISTITYSFFIDSTKGFFLNNTTEIILEDLVLKDSKHGGFTGGVQEYITSTISLHSVSNITIASCWFNGAGQHVKLNGYDNVHVLDNYFENGQFHVSNYNSKNPNDQNLFVKGNTFVGPWAGSRSAVFIIGDDSSYPNSGTYAGNINVEDNLVDCKESYSNQKGFYFQYLKEVTVKNNVVKNGYYGVFLSSMHGLEFESNYIHSASYRGIEAAGLYDASFRNNFIQAKGNNHIQHCERLYFMHNTFQTNTGLWDLFLDDIDDSLAIVNNIFDTKMNSNCLLRLGNVETNKLYLDYNVYSSLEDSVIRFNNYTHNGTVLSDYYTLSNFQALQSDLDRNAQTLLPTYISAHDLHIGDTTMYRIGESIAEAQFDFDGELRDSLVGIDVGADQFIVDTSGFNMDQVYQFGEYCVPLGAEHTICFDNGLSSMAQSSFELTSTEDDGPSDFNIHYLDYSIDSNNITVTFKVYNKYKWHTVSETFYLPNEGDYESSDVQLHTLDSLNNSAYFDFHFKVTKLGDDTTTTTETNIFENIDESNHASIYRNSRSNYGFSSKMYQVNVYSLEGKLVHYANHVQAIDIPQVSGNMYIIRAWDMDLKPNTWKVMSD